MPTVRTSAHATPRVLLRLEGAACFALCLALYARSGASWATFSALFLVPDVSLAGYLLGPRLGAAAYNTLHSELGPLLLAAACLSGIVPAFGLSLALIWGAHVSFDRALGYGLKYSTSFTETHLGLIGKAARAAATRSLHPIAA